MTDILDEVTKNILELVSDYKGEYQGAYSIRGDGQCLGRKSSKNVTITGKTDKPGIDITVAPGTKGETVYIPTCVSKGGIDDLVYNDFFIGPDCDIVIVAGCGVHTDDHSKAKHNGVHSFFIGENSHVRYEEKHIGTGDGAGDRVISPETHIELQKNAFMEMDTTQISGITSSVRTTQATADDAGFADPVRCMGCSPLAVSPGPKVLAEGCPVGSGFDAADLAGRDPAHDHLFPQHRS